MEEKNQNQPRATEADERFHQGQVARQEAFKAREDAYQQMFQAIDNALDSIPSVTPNENLDQAEVKRYQTIMSGDNLNKSEKLILAIQVSEGQGLSDAINVVNDLRLANLKHRNADISTDSQASFRYWNDDHSYTILGICPDDKGFLQGVYSQNGEAKTVELTSSPSIDPTSGEITFANGVKTTLLELSEASHAGNTAFQTLKESASHVYGKANFVDEFKSNLYTDPQEVKSERPNAFQIKLTRD